MWDIWKGISMDSDRYSFVVGKVDEPVPDFISKLFEKIINI
jgi:hypothetical protein